MSIVHVTHPVPVRLVPRGARNERLVFAPATTPVRLREVSLAEMDRVGAIGEDRPHRQRELYAHGGRLWTRLKYGYPPMGKNLLLRFCRGAMDDDLMPGSDLANAFAMTPLRVGTDQPWTPATAEDVAGARRVAWDGTEGARAALVRFMEEDVLLADGTVFVRSLGPMLTQVHRQLRLQSFDEAVLEGTPFPQHVKGWVPHGCRVDRVAEWWAFQKRNGSWEASRRDEPLPVTGIEGEIPSDLVNDGDLILFANAAPAVALVQLRDLLRTFPVEGAERLPDRLAPLVPYADRGALLGIPPEEFESAITLVRDAVKDTVAVYAAVGSDLRVNGLLRGLARFADEVALPRVVADEVAPDDAQALAGMAP